MNALYVTVSIPLLLVMAGFNHAYGLTTFGKTPNNNQQPPQPPVIQAKVCDDHSTCRGIQGSSCVPEPVNPIRKSCLCGDGTIPANGACKADRRGPRHLCTDSSQCVPNAECKPMNKNAGPGQDVEKTCQCVEGFHDFIRESRCSGAQNISIFTGLLVVLVALSRTL